MEEMFGVQSRDDFAKSSLVLDSWDVGAAARIYPR